MGAADNFTKRERALAWLITGPLGHLASGLADWGGAVLKAWRTRL
jgi:hypothetical protein